MPKLDRDEILRRIKRRLNVEEDELKVHGFKTDEEILKFYLTSVGAAASDESVSDDEDKSTVVEDNYKPTAQQKKEIKHVVAAEEKVADKKREEVYKKGAADLSHLPKGQQVTREEGEDELRRLGLLPQRPKGQVQGRRNKN